MRTGTVCLVAFLSLLSRESACADVLASYDITDTFLGFSSESLTSGAYPAFAFVNIIRLNGTLQVDICTPGYYSSDNAQSCTACPAGTYSETFAATTVDTCIACEPGKFSAATGGNRSSSCTDCPSGTYSTGMGMQAVSSCVACPPNSTSYDGSKLLQSCFCNPGFQGPNGGPCTACNTSVWCLNGRANPCPPNSKSAVMSSSLAQCFCLAGFFGDTTIGGPDLTLCQVCVSLLAVSIVLLF